MKKKRVALGRTADRPLWLLYLSVCIRAIHQFGAAVFLASFLYDELLLSSTCLVLTVMSGFLLVGTEAVRHRQLYRECAGVATMVKLVLIGAAYHGFIPETFGMASAFMLAALAAHVPKNIRHRLLF
ncbi:MAG: hypothetical protein CSA26_06840 [Desulfobacterales bacterium]|nr:MAG: hypothetical protein CSA26_06840 [Desulfobacterales bacterium]